VFGDGSRADFRTTLRVDSTVGRRTHTIDTRVGLPVPATQSQRDKYSSPRATWERHVHWAIKPCRLRRVWCPSTDSLSALESSKAAQACYCHRVL